MFSTKKTLPVRTARTNQKKSSILTDQRQVVILFREGLHIEEIQITACIQNTSATAAVISVFLHQTNDNHHGS